MEKMFIYGFKIEGEDIYRFLEVNSKKYDLYDSWYYQFKKYIGEKHFDKYFYAKNYDSCIYFGVLKEINDFTDNELNLSDIFDDMWKIHNIKKLSPLFLFLLEKRMKDNVYILTKN